jgi:hypothetical protein
LAAETAAAKTTTVAGLTRARPARRPFTEHVPRERVIVPGPVTCACYGGARLSKLGEDVTETLEVVLRQWKVVQHVREKFSCRSCSLVEERSISSALVRLGIYLWWLPHLRVLTPDAGLAVRRRSPRRTISRR